jgi:hypothetical protein
MKIQADLFTALEKITTLSFCIFITSLALFINLYLIYNHGITIRHVNAEWVKGRAIFSEIVTFGIWFVVLYLFAFPILHWLTKVIFVEIYFRLPTFFPTERRDSRGYVSLTELRDFAIQNNNSMAYKFYEDCQEARKSDERYRTSMETSCFSIVLLLLVLFIWFRPFVYAELQMLPESFYLPLIGFLCMTVYFTFHDITRENIYDGLIYLPSFQSWKKENTSMEAATEPGSMRYRP